MPLADTLEFDEGMISEPERFKCELFFGIEQCKILLLEATKPFLIPGTFVDENGISYRGLNVDRTVTIGDRLLIRFDRTKIDRVDLQYTLVDREESFRLTQAQFRSIKNKLKVV